MSTDNNTQKKQNELEELESEGLKRPAPEELTKAYLSEAKGKTKSYYYKNNPSHLVFKETSRSLVTKEKNDATIKTMVGVAQSKGWSKISVKGSKDFKGKAWLEAKLAGLDVSGYKPTEKDEQLLELKQKEKDQAENKEKDAESKKESSESSKDKPTPEEEKEAKQVEKKIVKEEESKKMDTEQTTSAERDVYRDGKSVSLANDNFVKTPETKLKANAQKEINEAVKSGDSKKVKDAIKETKQKGTETTYRDTNQLEAFKKHPQLGQKVNKILDWAKETTSKIPNQASASKAYEAIENKLTEKLANGETFKSIKPRQSEVKKSNEVSR